MHILVAGESWLSTSTHVKGFDEFSSSVYHSGAQDWIRALEFEAKVTYLPNHAAARDFPQSLDALREYDLVLLSDVGANTLLLHPDTWERGLRVPNRLKLLKTYVEGGGALAMAGGYLSFQGFQAKAGYWGTAVEDVLPVTLSPYDDRLEAPEGLNVTLHEPGHPVLDGVSDSWPYLLGLNRVAVKPGATLVASAGGYPLLVLGFFGVGRTAAWTTDIGPHWCPEVFCEWPGYAKLWHNLARWLVRG